MKLATKRNGTRDGELVVVSTDLSRYIEADPIANTLQSVLDDWVNKEAPLKALYDDLNKDISMGQPFDQASMGRWFCLCQSC